VRPDVQAALLSAGRVLHVYAFGDDRLVASMDVEEPE
jgi:hypothetical protein